jgi:creatinine amidohydrolase/Fe(II)-dependent formamide hydrolase-like protein
MGTISMREETFQAILTDMVQSFKVHGFKNIILIGDSGGNTRGMAAVAAKFNAEWNASPVVAHIREYYDYDSVSQYMEKQGLIKEGQSDGLHDDPIITMNMMVTDPNSVRWEQRVKAKKATINGVSIADKAKALALGKRIVDYRADITATKIKEAIANKGVTLGGRGGGSR